MCTTNSKNRAGRHVGDHRLDLAAPGIGTGWNLQLRGCWVSDAPSGEVDSVTVAVLTFEG